MNVGAWNGITSEVNVETLIFSDNQSTEADIIIKGSSDSNQAGYVETTRYDNGATITLNTSNRGLTTLTDEGKIIVLIHEIGHVFGLSHPNHSGCKDYKSIMTPSTEVPSLSSEEITTHGAYNIIKLYE